jgi:general secretion pathway protein L
MVGIDFVEDWYCWWRWEIGKIASGRRSGDSAGVVAVLRLGRDGVRIERPGSGGEAASAVTNPDEAGAAVRALAAGARRRLRVDLLIEPDRYLMRPLSRLRLPRSRMRAMARLDCSSSTPFRAEDCFLIIPQYREENAASSYYIVRKAHLEALLEGLRRARITLRDVALLGADGLILPDQESAAAIRRPPPLEALMRSATRWGAATAAAGLLAVVGVMHWRYAAALGTLDRQIVEAERDAEVVQGIINERYRQIARIAAARSAKSEAVPLVRVLEELARTLPDATWLTEVEFGETTVTFTGISDSAAALIPSLEASPLFRAPTFSQPVVRDAGQDGERFTITMETEAADG